MVQESDARIERLRAPSRRSRAYKYLRHLSAAALAALMLASGCHTPYESGLSHYTEGKLSEAERDVRAGLEQNPNDPRLNLLMARVLSSEQKFRKAQPFAERAFESGKLPAQAGRVLGKIHWELGRPIEAAEAWRTAREADPDSVADEDFQRALEAAIATAMTLQKFEQALELRSELTDIAPEHPDVSGENFRINRERLAQTMVREGEYEEAVELYRSLAQEYPSEASYARALGRLLIELQRTQEAIDAFGNYVSKAEERFRTDRILEVARRAVQLDSPEVAVHFYEQAREAMSANPTFRRAKLELTLAGLYFEANRPEDGKKAIARYLDDMKKLRGLPLEGEVYITAADTASEHNQGEYALELLERGLEEAPASWPIASKLASLYARRALANDVERVLQTYVKRAKDTNQANLRVARWALDRRNYDIAQHFFERAVEGRNVEAGTWLELARVYSTVGQIDKMKVALATYTKKRDPERYELLDVASMYQKHRLYEDAEKVLLRAHKDEPKSMVVVGRLAELYDAWGKPAKIHAYYEAWLEARGKDADDYRVVGERFVRRGNPNEALPYLEKAAEAGSPEAWLQIADIYSRQRRDADMKAALDSYLEQTPETASTLRSVLRRYRSAGMDNEAIAILERLVELEPGMLSHYEQLSALYFDQGRERAAFQLWTGYLDQSSRPMETLERISHWFTRRGHPEWILSLYRRLLERGDADPELYRLIGDTYLDISRRRRQIQRMGRSNFTLNAPVKQAKHFYELYLEKASPSRTELLDFADSMRSHELWEVAAGIYEKLGEKEAEGSQMWRSYATVLIELGEVQKAEKLLASYYKARGENLEDASAVANELYDAQRYAAARPYLRKMFDSERPNYVDSAFRRLSNIYQATGRSDQMDTLITEFLERAQNPTKARQEVLVVLQKAGLYEQAAEQIERIRAFQGDVLGYQLAENLFRAGKTDRAAELFRTYASQNAYPGDAWITVGEFYAQHGAGELAAKAYKSAVSAAPDKAKAHANLGRFQILRGEVDEGREALALARKKVAASQKEDLWKTEVEALVRVGRFADARDAAQEAAAESSRYREFFTKVRADYDLATQKPAKAQRTVQELLKSSVNLRDRVSLLVGYGFLEEAAKLLEDEISGGDYYTAARVVVDRPDLLTNLGGFDRLERALAPVLEKPNEGLMLRAQLGEYLISQGEYQRGIPYLRSAVAQGMTDFRGSLAQAYAALGYHDEALRIYQKYLENTPEARLGEALEVVGTHFELHGRLDHFKRLLGVLLTDQRYAAHAAPLLAELHAENGSLAEASSVIFEATSQSRRDDEASASSRLVIDTYRDGEIDTLVNTIEAIGGEGYVEEARGFVQQLSPRLRRDDRIQNLEMVLAAARSKEAVAEQIESQVGELGLSHEDNQQRLRVAHLLLRHGYYDLAHQTAAEGLKNPDYRVSWNTTSFLLGNAVAATDDERVQTLANDFLAGAQNKMQARQDLAERFRTLGRDDLALEHAAAVAEAVPTQEHVIDALIIAQAGGDREQLAALTDQLMRVGTEPTSYLNSFILRWRTQQAPELTAPLLVRYTNVYPADFDTRLIDLILSFRAGEVDEGRAKIEQALEFAAYDPYMVERLLAELNKAGLYVEAARFVSPKLDGRPQTSQTRLLLGIAHRELGLTEQARQHFDAYVESAPDKASAAADVAEEMLERDFIELVSPYANEAIREAPERPKAHFFRGVARLADQEVDKARRDLDQSIGAGVNRTYGLFWTGKIALEAGQSELASEYLGDLARTASPNDPGLPLRVAMNSYTEADAAEAGVAFVEREFPTLAASTGILGEALLPQVSGLYEAAGQYSRAYGLYEDAIAEQLVRSPNDSLLVVYLNNLAYTYSTTNARLDEGFDLVRRAIAASPGRTPSYLDTLGWLQYRRGELDAAETNVRAALRTTSGGRGSLAELVEHLVEIRKAQGRHREALWWKVYWESLQ